MRIVPIPCLSDNYAYLLVCRETKEAAIVDPEAGPVLGAIDQGAGTQDSRRDLASLANHHREDVRIVAILSTHHHHNHVGGNEEVLEARHRSRLRPRERSRAHPRADAVPPGERDVEIGRLKVRVLHIPGHTLGAVAYVVTREPTIRSSSPATRSSSAAAAVSSRAFRR